MNIQGSSYFDVVTSSLLFYNFVWHLLACTTRKSPLFLFAKISQLPDPESHFDSSLHLCQLTGLIHECCLLYCKPYCAAELSGKL